MSYAGAVTNAVGGELQGWAAVLDKMEMADQLRQEQARQNAYRDKAMSTFNEGLTPFSSSSAVTKLADATTGRMQRYQGLQSVPLGPSRMVGQSRINSIASPTMDVLNRARAANAAYGDWQHGLNISSLNNQRKLAQILSFAKGTASVFPYRMYQAQHANDDLAMIGQAISSIGGGASNYAQFAGGPSTSQSQQLSGLGDWNLPTGSGGNGWNPNGTDVNTQWMLG